MTSQFTSLTRVDEAHDHVRLLGVPLHPRQRQVSPQDLPLYPRQPLAVQLRDVIALQHDVILQRPVQIQHVGRCRVVLSAVKMFWNVVQSQEIEKLLFYRPFRVSL